MDIITADEARKMTLTNELKNIIQLVMTEISKQAQQGVNGVEFSKREYDVNSWKQLTSTDFHKYMSNLGYYFNNLGNVKIVIQW